MHAYPNTRWETPFSSHTVTIWTVESNSNWQNHCPQMDTQLVSNPVFPVFSFNYQNKQNNNCKKIKAEASSLEESESCWKMWIKDKGGVCWEWWREAGEARTWMLNILLPNQKYLVKGGGGYFSHIIAYQLNLGESPHRQTCRCFPFWWNQHMVTEIWRIIIRANLDPGIAKGDNFALVEGRAIKTQKEEKSD